MNKIEGKITLTQLFGETLRKKRKKLSLSQMEMARKMGCPQSMISRLERGLRSPTLEDLAALARAFRISINDLLAELEPDMRVKSADAVADRGGGYGVVPNPMEALSHWSALAGEEETLAQLAAHGVRFLGAAAGPTVFKRRLEETLVAALRYVRDPRLFESLPALVLRNAMDLNWLEVLSGTFALQLQNRLGLVVSAALQMKSSLPGAPQEAWTVLEAVRRRLAEAKLDRREILGPEPKSPEALELLARRTPDWMREWKFLGSGDAGSFKRHRGHELR